MSRLALALLGSFQASLDGLPVEGFRSDKARALLVYLAVEAMRTHARYALATLLWPDTSDKAALTYLRGALANLRHLLGDQAATGAAREPFLLVTRETLQLNPAADVWLDVAAFAALGAQNPSRQALENAAALYRGPFLEGFSIGDSTAFDEWLLLTREHYNRQALAALQQLAALALQQHRCADAETYSRRQLALEPWDESAHRQLMAALAQSGSRSAALAHYAACRRLLAQELGVEPAHETTALYQQIRAGHLSVGAAPAANGSTGLSPGARELSPFVARSLELAQLDAQLALMLDGAGRVVFVRGDAGSGKSALLHEFRRRAMQRHSEIAMAEGRCSDYSGGGDGYLPFREIVQQLAGGSSSEGGWSDGAPWLSGSKARASAGAAPEPGPPPIGQSDFFEQVTGFLLDSARRHPLILLLDDLQWAGPGTIGLLFHCSRRLIGSRILVVGAYRPEDIAQSGDRQRHPLTMVVHELQRSFGEAAIDLNNVDGRAFVDALLDSEPNHLGPAFRDTLYRHTEGHALFTVELLRAMKERGALVQDADGRWVAGANMNSGSFPPRVEAVIAERIERLPRRLRSLLEAASVEGNVFCAEMLALQSRTPATHLGWWLSELLCRQHGLIRAESRSSAAAGIQPLLYYRFAHSLYQTYLYNHLDAARCASLHRQVGEALEQLHAAARGEYAVSLAWHFEQAGDLEKAVQYHRLAGDQAMRLSTCEDAIAHYIRALVLLGTVPSLPDRLAQESALHLALAKPLTIMRGWGNSETRAAVQHAYELSCAADDRRWLVEAMRTLSTTYVGRAELAQALETGNALMLAAQQSQNPLALAAAHFALGEAEFFRCELASARRHLEQVVTLLDQQKPATVAVTGVDTEVASLQWLALTLLALGCPEQAAACAGRARARAQTLDQPSTLGSALLIAGAMVNLQLGEVSAAEINVAAAQQICVEYDLTLYHGMVDIFQGYLAAIRGAPAAGIAQIEQGLAAWQAPGTAGGAVYYRMMLALALQAAGQIERGLATVVDALALVERTGLAYAEAELWRIKGELLPAQNAAKAEECFQRAIAIARRQQTRLWELRATMDLCRLWQRQGRQAQALPMLAAIYDCFSEGFAAPDLRAARVLLTELATAHNTQF